ncbi:MAG: hypothetical protein ACOYBL_13890 [Lachnospiraceae bacterium]
MFDDVKKAMLGDKEAAGSKGGLTMRKSLKRQALEHILDSMKEVEINLKCNQDVETIKAKSEAMKNLALAYTLVKRGVILPDAWEELEKRVRGENGTSNENGYK